MLHLESMFKPTLYGQVNEISVFMASACNEGPGKSVHMFKFTRASQSMDVHVSEGKDL